VVWSCRGHFSRRGKERVTPGMPNYNAFPVRFNFSELTHHSSNQFGWRSHKKSHEGEPC